MILLNQNGKIKVLGKETIWKHCNTFFEKVNDIKFTKIVCGESHGLCLTDKT